MRAEKNRDIAAPRLVSVLRAAVSPWFPATLLLLGACATPLAAQSAVPATQPATQPAEGDALSRLKDEERREVVDRLAGLPPAGPFARDEVLRLELEDNRIVARTRIPPTDGPRRLLVNDDADGLWHGTVHGNLADRTPSGIFLIERYDFADPDVVFTLAAITVNPMHVSITGNWEKPDGMLQLDLIDRAGSMDDEGGIDTGGTRLIISGFGLEGDRTVNVRLEARDLTTLRRRQPRLINTYLRPVLRQLGQERLLAIDQRLAWQVLGGQRPVDKRVEQRVRELLPRLDADAFAERQAAARELRELGDEAALVLMRMDRSTLSPEQRAQVDQVLALHKPASSKDVRALADDLDFLLDVLLTDDPDLRRLALARLREKTNQAIDFDLDADATTRSNRVADLRATLLPPPATQATQ